MNDPNEPLKEAIKNAAPAQFPDFTEVNEALKEAARHPVAHLWRQRGPEIYCSSCQHQHSQWIGVDRQLVGIDERGRPIIEKRR